MVRIRDLQKEKELLQKIIRRACYLTEKFIDEQEIEGFYASVSNDNSFVNFTRRTNTTSAKIYPSKNYIFTPKDFSDKSILLAKILEKDFDKGEWTVDIREY